MKIKKISFYRADRKEDGAMCKCCGAWVKNVCVVDTEEEGRITLGTTCYEKQIKTRLNDMQKKKFNKLVKRVKNLQELVIMWENTTEETCRYPYGYTWRDYEDCNCFEDYRKFYEEATRKDLEEATAELAKYGVGA